MTDINQETKSQPFISKCIVDTHCKVRINVSQTYVIDCFSQTCLRVNYIITLIITLPGSTVQTERITFGSLNLQTTQSASQCIFIKSFSQLFYSLLIRSKRCIQVPFKVTCFYRSQAQSYFDTLIGNLSGTDIISKVTC